MDGCVVLLLIFGAVVVIALIAARNNAPAVSSSSIAPSPPTRPTPSRAPAAGRITVTVSSPGRVQVPRDLADRLWVRSGAQVQVGGHRIPGGMLYVGAGLPGVGRWSDVEPALIDPSLPCRSSQSDREGKLMSYWSSYAHIQPASRA